MKVMAIIGAVIMSMFSVFPLQADAEGRGNARLSLMEGDVQIRAEDSAEWLPASINMPLMAGDRIWVPDNSRAEVQAIGGVQVRLDESSSLEILSLGMDFTQVYLSGGSAYVNFSGRKGLVQIDTPLFSGRAYDRAVFAVDVSRTGETDLSIYKGSITAESRSGKTTVDSGEMLSVGSDYAELSPLGAADDWERWNRDRDRMLDSRRYASSRYLPEELDAYAGDFDDNGRWVTVREYGYVWTPTVSVYVGWSPYRHGRWYWSGGDYIWIGYEPWGWAPYHYGRWAFAELVGWFWVPPARGSVYWGPGYVGWVSTPTYVAWVPLAPYETYYGHGYYGPHSVNIVTMQRNKVIVKDAYKNVHAHNGVMVVHHDTFVKGRPADFRPPDNPFLKEKIHIGRPDIKPERETRMPVLKDIPPYKEPPQRVKEISTKELKKQRPLVIEQHRSVLAPEVPGGKLKVKASDTPKERRRARPSEKKQEKAREPVEKQQPEETQRGPVKKERSEDRSNGTYDLRDRKEGQDNPEQGPSGHPPRKEKPRKTDEREQKRPEKLRKYRSGAESQTYERSTQRRAGRSAETEQQKEQGDRMSGKRPAKGRLIQDQEEISQGDMAQSEGYPGQERKTAPDRRIKYEEPEGSALQQQHSHTRRP